MIRKPANTLTLRALQIGLAVAQAATLGIVRYTRDWYQLVRNLPSGKWKGRGTPGAFGTSLAHITPPSTDPRFMSASARRRVGIVFGQQFRVT